MYSIDLQTTKINGNTSYAMKPVEKELIAMRVILFPTNFMIRILLLSKNRLKM